MPVYRHRPLLYRGNRPYDLHQRINAVQGSVGLVSDSFKQRTLIGTSDGFDGYGADKAWTVQSGAYACSAGNLVCSSAGIATIDPGVADNIRFEFQLAFAPNGNSNRCLVRFTDASNYLAILITNTGYRWQTVIAGTPANTGSGAGVTLLSGDVIIGSVIANNSSLQAYRNGVALAGPATTTSASSAGQTPIGVAAADTAFALSYLKVRRGS